MKIFISDVTGMVISCTALQFLHNDKTKMNDLAFLSFSIEDDRYVNRQWRTHEWFCMVSKTNKDVFFGYRTRTVWDQAPYFYQFCYMFLNVFLYKTDFYFVFCGVRWPYTSSSGSTLVHCYYIGLYIY